MVLEWENILLKLLSTLVKEKTIFVCICYKITLKNGFLTYSFLNCLVLVWLLCVYCVVTVFILICWQAFRIFFSSPHHTRQWQSSIKWQSWQFSMSGLHAALTEALRQLRHHKNLLEQTWNKTKNTTFSFWISLFFHSCFLASSLSFSLFREWISLAKR